MSCDLFDQFGLRARYRALGAIGSGAGKLIQHEHQLQQLDLQIIPSKAFIHGIRLLGYSDSSVRALSQKLRSKGYEKEIAERAAAALEEHGYIREREIVLRKGDRIAEVKLRGKRRVAEELLTAGYKREYVSEWMKTTEIDFSAICARVITKKGGIPEAADRDGRRKLLSYLYRQGFSSDDVRGAIEIL